MEGNRAPAGWYVDPDDEALQRFWNGSRWTNSRMPRGEGVPLEGEAIEQLPPKAKAKANEGMVMAGYLTSFLLPIAGVVIGVILVSRENRHGRWIIGLSILFLVVFFVIGNTVEVDENP